MARFNEELPYDLIKELETLEGKTEIMMTEMLQKSAKQTYNLIKSNMKKSFKTTKSLEQGLTITKIYRTPSDDGLNVHIDFYGYVKDSKPTERHPYGTPIPLIALAREYGTSWGSKDHEPKKPFMRKSFKKKEVLEIMKDVEKKYIKGD